VLATESKVRLRLTATSKISRKISTTPTEMGTGTSKETTTTQVNLSHAHPPLEELDL
jgi:hypothetical protein